ncbi:hypothetical protein JCM10295v2_006919 [Rhodotorula toruloides]
MEQLTDGGRSSRAPSSTPTTRFEKVFGRQTHQDQQGASGESAGGSGGGQGVLGAANEERETWTIDASQRAEGPLHKRIKREGGERWTREEELALLEIRKGLEKVTWVETPEKMVAKGFTRRSALARQQRFQAMDGARDNPRPATKRDNSWTDDERLALLAINIHRDSTVFGFCKPSINWTSWQAFFPGKTKYQLQQKAAELRKTEEAAKLKTKRYQAREATIQAKWQSLQAAKAAQASGQRGAIATTSMAAMSATEAVDGFFLTLEDNLAAFSTSQPTTAPGSGASPSAGVDTFVHLPSTSYRTEGLAQTGSLHPHFSSTFPAPTASSARTGTLSTVPLSHSHQPHVDPYLDFPTDPQVPQMHDPLNPLPRTTFGQSTSAQGGYSLFSQRVQQPAFTLREQQHQPIAAASVVSSASPLTRQSFVAAEIAKLVVDASEKAVIQTTAAGTQEPVVGEGCAKEGEKSLRMDLSDEEDTSRLPMSKAGMKLEERLRGIGKSLKE